MQACLRAGTWWLIDKRGGQLLFDEDFESACYSRRERPDSFEREKHAANEGLSGQRVMSDDERLSRRSEHDLVMRD